MLTIRSSKVRFYLVASCLFFSGAGSLVLEVVWSRLLKLVFGSTTLAISTILVAYMLGLGLGGLFGGRIASRLRNGVRTYGVFEIAIAGYALLVPFLLSAFPLINDYLLHSMGFWTAALIRFVLVLLFLLLPTVLMGATLPILVAALTATSEDFAKRVGLLYGLNTLGAVAGVIGATFVLFPLMGVAWTNVFGALLDAAAGLAAIVFLAKVPSVALGKKETQTAKDKKKPRESPWKRWNLPLVSYGLVGFSSLVYEVCWTRALSMVLGSSIYAFASMLAAFLAGIAVGSLIARRWFDALLRPLRAYSIGLALLGTLSLSTVLLLKFLPDAFLAVMHWQGLSGKTLLLASVVLSIGAMLGPTLVLGALFPLLVRAVAGHRPDSGQTVGDVYFVNTVGSALGAFSAGFVLIPWIGLQSTMAVALFVNFASSAVIMLYQQEWKGPRRMLAAAAMAIAAIVVWITPPDWDAAAMTRGVYYNPDWEMDFGVELLPLENLPDDRIAFYKDGLNTTVSMHYTTGGLDMRLNGKPDASLMDMSTQVLSGHIPMAFGKHAEDVLVIGYASGVTTGSVTLYDPKRVDVVELEPAVIEASRLFDDYNFNPLENPSVHRIIEDGRTYLAYADRKYDVIISEPSNPWISGASNLFTREFFGYAHRALKPGGRLLQWIQLYGMDPVGFRSILSSLTDEFPYVYGFLYGSDDVDFLMLASDEELRPEDLPRWELLPKTAQEDLRRVGVYSTADFWSLMRLSATDISSMAEDAEIANTDDNMYVELHAPLTMYENPFDNWAVLREFKKGILPVAEGDGQPLPAAVVADLALSYFSARKDEQVMVELMKIAKTRGASAPEQVAKARLMIRDRLGRADDAVAVLNQAIASDPNYLPAYATRAKLLEDIGRLDGALRDLDFILDREPRDYRARLARLRVLNKLARWDQSEIDAQAIFDARLDVFEWAWRVWSDSAIAAAARGEYKLAAHRMEQYVGYNRSSVRDWQWLGKIYESAGDKAKAESAQRNASLAHANNLRRSHRRALLIDWSGNTPKAIEILEGLVERAPEYLEASDDLKRLRDKQRGR